MHITTGGIQAIPHPWKNEYTVLDAVAIQVEGVSLAILPIELRLLSNGTDVIAHACSRQHLDIRRRWLKRGRPLVHPCMRVKREKESEYDTRKHLSKWLPVHVDLQISFAANYITLHPPTPTTRFI